MFQNAVNQVYSDLISQGLVVTASSALQRNNGSSHKLDPTHRKTKSK